ncbi:hypothetical protein N8368_00690 [Bacteroidia bacterium]|nr:hypothetical protein [Bacteroidia bacterium]MDC1395005.1 hypothetical protein [Bacteroidia bacterium]
MLVAINIFTISTVLGQTIDTLTNERLDRRDDGLFYEQQSETPFYGVVLLDHYYPVEIEYVNGEKVRKCTYYKNGEKKSEENYVNGQQEGVQTSWYETGQKQSEFHYKNGEQEGLQTLWYNYLEASVNDTEEAEGYMEFYDDGASVTEEAVEATEESIDVIEDAPLGAMEAGVETSQASRRKDKSNEIVKEWLGKEQKESEKNYVNGQKEGLQMTWHRNGQKESEYNYANGKRKGLQNEWYENGQKKSESNSGEREGLVTEWYENGQKKSERNYINENLNGLQAEWYKNGQKKSEGTINGQKGIRAVEWYENGQKKSKVNFINGKPDGEQAKWYENGQKKYECNIVSGQLDSLLTMWYENGQKHIESSVFYEETKFLRNESIQLWAGLLVSKGGTIKVWQPNGERIGSATAKLVEGKYYVLQETWYQNGQKQYEFNLLNGQNEGKQTSWYENGQKESEGVFLNGKQEGKQLKWYEGGQKESEGVFLNGKQEGKQLKWYEGGQKQFEINYLKGIKDGQWTKWYENGQKKAQYSYRNDIRKGMQTEWDINGERINKENVSRPNKASSKNEDTTYAAHFFSLDDSKSKFKILAAKDNFFSYTIDGKLHDSAQEPLIKLTVGPYYLADKVLDEGELQVWVNTVFNMVFGSEDLDIIYESDLGANGYTSYAVLKRRSNDEAYLYFQSIVHKGNEVQIMVSQEGGVFDAEEIRKLIRTIKMK